MSYTKEIDKYHFKLLKEHIKFHIDNEVKSPLEAADDFIYGVLAVLSLYKDDDGFISLPEWKQLAPLISRAAYLRRAPGMPGLVKKEVRVIKKMFDGRREQNPAITAKPKAPAIKKPAAKKAPAKKTVAKKAK